jgi:alkanesulfonate monooxygenase SsuD/methylene tetrahydromethanopterin reductase-like flavin-dependent oxidoreductase (luciferase family)
MAGCMRTVSPIHRTHTAALLLSGDWAGESRAKQIADVFEEWMSTGAADGFNYMAPVLPAGLKDFITLVIPELQRRGLYRTSYSGSTLRDNLGLPRRGS